MKLTPIETPEDFLLAQQFVIPHEETCVSLASLVRRKTDNLFFISDSHISVRKEKLLGIISLDSTIYHCIPDIRKLETDSFSEELKSAFKKSVRCLSGEKAATDFLLKLFPAWVIAYDYKMMKWQGTATNKVTTEGSAVTELSGGEEIIRCTEHDLEILHPLQKDYMKEEVAVPGHQLTDAEVDITLRQILKNQLCFALACDGEVVSKANTNAIGLNCVQLGGVYTHPLYRKNGYAGALVQTLCNRASRAHKQPVLFVKEKNMPAFSLYQKLGFAECGQYTIAYY